MADFISRLRQPGTSPQWKLASGPEHHSTAPTLTEKVVLTIGTFSTFRRFCRTLTLLLEIDVHVRWLYELSLICI
jgi:hypothetical protein